MAIASSGHQISLVTLCLSVAPCRRTRGEELKAAVGEWQSRHALERVLTTGFLDGTHPIVDTYELKVGD